MLDDVADIPARYARRGDGSIYSMLRNEVQLAHFERFKTIVGLLNAHAKSDFQALKLVDLGCGTGGNLLDFLRLGFRSENLVGLELLEGRAKAAKEQLPAATQIVVGDASAADIAEESVDIVFQSVVFSSLLSDDFQEHLARSMWRWIRPGGGVLWYDFIYDNPRNADVRGVPLKRVRALFPDGKFTVRRITLAPPISRRVGPWSTSIHNLLNALPFLRTHLMVWIEK